MRKRTIYCLCALALCAAMFTPALGAEKAAKETEPSKVSWEDLAERVRTGSFGALAVSEQIQQIESIDYDKMEKNLRDQINEIGKLQSQILGSAGGGAVDGTLPPASQDPGDIVNAAMNAAAMQAELSASMNALESAYNSLRPVYDDLRNGKTQKENTDTVRLLKDGVEQIVAGSQSLYLSILSLEQTYADGLRGIEAIDRSLTELRLRQQLGQVSKQTVQGLEQTRANTVTQMAALESSIATCKAQLQSLMGEEPNGQLTLEGLPELEEATLEALDPVVDLESAKEKSAELFSAGKTLQDAKEDWATCGFAPGNFRRVMAEHAWNAAQMTYQSKVQSFETGFQTLYRTINDDRIAVQNKTEAVDYAETVLQSEKTRFDRGLISKNKLAEAQDNLTAAQSELDGARLKLFQDYHAYQNAVNLGILNQRGAQ